MKNNKVIIYDDDCPLCNLYTAAFVSGGMIEKENRKSFNNVDHSILASLDTKRYCNEIPVIDLQTGQVWYGIDALTEILQVKILFARQIMNNPFINYVLKKIYKLISYNRRVIVARQTLTGNFNCSPDFNYTYRAMFLCIFCVFNTIMLSPLYTNIFYNSFITVSYSSFMILHAFLVLVNIISSLFLEKKIAFQYLGQINMLALTCILLLVPLLVINKLLGGVSNWINNIYFIPVGIFIGKEYVRRMNYAGISKEFPFVVLLNILSIAAFLWFLF